MDDQTGGDFSVLDLPAETRSMFSDRFRDP